MLFDDEIVDFLEWDLLESALIDLFLLIFFILIELFYINVFDHVPPDSQNFDLFP